MTTAAMNGTSSKHSPCACANNFCPECGLPACRPIRPLKHVPGALLSTYDRDYDGKKGQRPDGLADLANKDKIYVPPAGKFQGRTTQRTDFPPKQAMPQGKKGKEHTAIPHRPFDGTTTYNTFHNKKPLAPKDPSKSPPSLDSPPFCGTSSYKAEYVGHKAEPYKPHMQDDGQLDLPFLGNSTYRDDFTPKPIPPKNPRPPQALLPSKNDLNYTTYGKDFVPKFLERKLGAKCCDIPSHTQSLQHSHRTAEQAMRESGSQMFGNSTGKLYKIS